MTEEDKALQEDDHISSMYRNWFLDYASYVILERAVPAIEDGLKPVQRRILHAMKEMDDGRFNKVANVIGQTMQYHPHGDASITDAMIGMGQKDLLIECQGNWGDIRTGDPAAAARYIEGRLSKFANAVVFNPKITQWQLSYDGRKKEPVTFPVKFPLLLAQGVEGIAVGLSTRILPHNFREIIKACIHDLKGKKFTLYPDFTTGGIMDAGEYNHGMRGGRIKVRANIEVADKKTLLIKDVPHGVTTSSLCDSITRANEKGKIKIKQVVDNTAKEIEVMVTLAPGQSPEVTIDALYAFTDCEVSISPNACVIKEEKPHFLSVEELLKNSNQATVELLRQELLIKQGELREKILFSSLEQIFIENRIYRDIEEAETWPQVLEFINKGLEPFKSQFYREITEADLIRLTEIKIKRISKYDSFKAEELLRKLNEELEETNYHLNNLVEFAIDYYQNLLEKFGKGRERKTEIKSFDTIAATVVAANNQKLYVNREDGFIGYGNKKDEFVTDCSDIDDIIVFLRNGTFKVVKIAEKVFVGKDIIHVEIFKKNDERKVYNTVYYDGKSKRSYIKRFQVLAVTRDRDYDLTRGEEDSKVLYFTANPNAEAETINVYLHARSRAKIKQFEFNFADLEVKGRGAQGNILTKYPIRKVELKRKGESTLGGLDVWYDEHSGRLNTDERGKHLGTFYGDDNLIAFYKDGTYMLKKTDLLTRFDPNSTLLVAKFDLEQVVSMVYYDGNKKDYYTKRFRVETSKLDFPVSIISEARSSRVLLVTLDRQPQVELTYTRKGSKKHEKQLIDLDVIVDVKGYRALGNKLTRHKVKKVNLVNESEPENQEEGTGQ
jgi:topoisomerase IV subunit A